MARTRWVHRGDEAGEEEWSNEDSPSWPPSLGGETELTLGEQQQSMKFPRLLSPPWPCFGSCPTSQGLVQSLK
ncbi:hypothetical protein DV515_00003069 [Chloebia gouldiae]|uniref:Uncharacterized protein n=1 Tax=Chloebia gouldiae TaxID=44316 RepID=A0A3L8SXM0_CHLGU|nr:hypothetical protein DV515_00003069 [Chloebia gouldiae]